MYVRTDQHDRYRREKGIVEVRNEEKGKEMIGCGSLQIWNKPGIREEKKGYKQGSYKRELEAGRYIIWLKKKWEEMLTGK